MLVVKMEVGKEGRY